MKEEVFEVINTLSDDLIQIMSDEKLLKQIFEIGSNVLDTSIPGLKVAMQVTNQVRIMKFKHFLKGIHSLCQKMIQMANFR